MRWRLRECCSRETSVIGAHELHSSAGTIFFCYGIVGTVLFGVFSWRVIQRGRLRYVLMLLPASAYGLTHQGLRFTLLWVLLAMFIALKDYERRRVVAAPPARRPGPLRRPLHPVGVQTR